MVDSCFCAELCAAPNTRKASRRRAKCSGERRNLFATFPERFGRHYRAGARLKIGLTTEEEGDADLFAAVLRWMHETRADFTSTFAELPSLAAPWHAQWQARLAREPGAPAEIEARLRRANPLIIPRNHRVEEALAAAEAGDLGPFERLLAALRSPCEVTVANEPYRSGPPAGCGPYRTYCGT